MVARKTEVTSRMEIGARMLARVAKYIERIAHFIREHDHGLVLLSGPMRGGKSMTVIATIDALRDVPTLRLKPRRDDRQTGLRTHTGIEAQAYDVAAAAELDALVREHTPSVIIVDEAQFFEEEVVLRLLALAEQMLVIVGTLDLTFEPQAWPAYTTLSAQGEATLGGNFLSIKLIGFCQKCGNERATHSMLTVEPPKEGTVLTGADVYLTVCQSCHQPPSA